MQSGKTWRVHSESRVKPQYLTCGHAAGDAWFTRKHTGHSLAITVCANCNSHCTETYKHTPIFVYVIKRLALENISLFNIEYQSKADKLVCENSLQCVETLNSRESFSFPEVVKNQSILWSETLISLNLTSIWHTVILWIIKLKWLSVCNRHFYMIGTRMPSKEEPPPHNFNSINSKRSNSCI